MKRTMILLFSLLLVNFSSVYCKESVNSNLSPGDSIRIFSTPDLYRLAMKWSDEYSKLNPGVKIGITMISDNRMAGQMIQKGNIGFVSKEYYPGLMNESIWDIVVGRDIVVPLINSKNPFLDRISTCGISPEALNRFFTNPDSMNWGTLLRNKETRPVVFCLTNDKEVASDMARFLRNDQIRFTGKEFSNVDEMISAIQKDPYALGFCKLTAILDPQNQEIAKNIRLMPIDRNGNGLLDYNEKIYDDLNIFSRGVWIGKYPKALYSNIYSVASDRPKNMTEIAFLNWIISGGQQFLKNYGYSDLLISERQTTADRIFTTKIYQGPDKAPVTLYLTIILILAALVISIILINGWVRQIKRKNAPVKVTGSFSPATLNENSILIPRGLYFDKAHTWAFMEQNGVVKIGVNDFILHITGSVTRMRMKNKGDLVKKGEEILSIIQNGKQLNLYAPVSGKIIEQNKTLETNPSIINSSPYNEGWIYLIEPTNWVREHQLLFFADKYREWMKHEITRLKDFLSDLLGREGEKYPGIILQDGGELRDRILSNFGPEVWDDFQTNFIDPSRQVWFYELF